jgi:hypothetical protein
MERRYLAATIAMAATFAIFSHAFGSGLLTKLHEPPTALISEMKCEAQTLRTELLAKVNHSLGEGSAEEAQLRVEFNLAPPVMAVAPAPPAPLASPSAVAIKAPSAPAIACPSQRLVTLRLPKDYERVQARAMAMQSKAFAEQAKMQSKALAEQARLMAVQATLTSREVQREITRAALAQARANVAQAKSKSHPCSGEHAVWVTSRSGDGGRDISVDVDTDQLSHQVEEQVSRSLRNSVRNF